MPVNPTTKADKLAYVLGDSDAAVLVSDRRALPVVAALSSPIWVTGGLAAVIVLLEGAQHLYQFQEHWITYRSTAEALKHERYLYLATAGPYGSEDRHRQLAERLEGLVSQEHAKWTASHRDNLAHSDAS